MIIHSWNFFEIKVEKVKKESQPKNIAYQWHQEEKQTKCYG